MGYCRSYSRKEVEQILRASEGRPRPYLKRNDNPAYGHAIGKHSGQFVRFSEVERIQEAGRKGRKGTELTMFRSFEDQVWAVTEALNSVPGQRKLKELEYPQTHRVRIRSIAIAGHADSIDLFYIQYDPTCEKDLKLETLADEDRVGRSCLVEVFVEVYKLEPPGKNFEIHVQTAFPLEWEVVAP